MNEYKLSEEYNLLSELYSEYKNKYALLKNEVDNNLSFEEYSNSDEGLHRGYYCPSLIHDIIIGGFKRGKIVKNDTKYTYIYKYNNKNELIFVWQDAYEEFVLKKGNTEIGLSFDNVSRMLSAISYCEYDKNRLNKYVFGVMWTKTDSSPLSIYKEKYVYTESEMAVDFYMSSYGLDEIEICTYLKYYFPLNNGFLSELYLSDSSPSKRNNNLKDIEPSELITHAIPKNKRRKIL